MNTIRWTLAVPLVLGMGAPLLGGELGDKASALVVKEWVRGKPVDVTTADGKNVYVVEFWATWCSPCLQSIPHVSGLQKKYKDKNVTFIGVSIDDQRTVDQVRPFMEKMGDKMDYTIAIDKDGATSKAYMDAFGIRGIPHAFVVNQKGQIIWHQNPHPSVPGLDEVIDKVVAGKFDVAAAKRLMAEREKEALERQRQFEALVGLMQDYFLLVRSTGKERQAAEVGGKILEGGRDNPALMSRLAWDILTQEGIVSRDLKLALAAAEAANTATNGENAAVLYMYALALFENGRKKDAVSVQAKAVELAKKDSMPEQMIAQLSEQLERFKREVD
jgi:thiol-disulfide isomerase/thioredoxin